MVKIVNGLSAEQLRLVSIMTYCVSRGTLNFTNSRCDVVTINDWVVIAICCGENIKLPSTMTHRILVPDVLCLFHIGFH